MCSNIGFMYQLYVTIFNWLISGYTLESELIILSENFCKKSIVHPWGSLQSEFLYVENAFQKLAIALPFWNNKTRQMGPKTNSNGVHTPDTLRGGVWSNVLVGSIRCAWPGGLSMLPSQNRSQRLRILYIPVSVRGFAASSRFWPDHLRTAQENWRCPSTTIITRDRAPTTVSQVNNRYPQSGLVHRAGLRYPLKANRRWQIGSREARCLESRGGVVPPARL